MRLPMDVLDALCDDHVARSPDAVAVAFCRDPMDPARLRFLCGRCGGESVDVSPWSTPFEVAAVCRGLLAKHEHPAPRPLTVEERERVRVRGIHRRGALRLQ